LSPAAVVFSAVPTLFSSDGEVDPGANRGLYKFVAELLDGLLVAGTTGEFPALEDGDVKDNTEIEKNNIIKKSKQDKK